MALSVIQVTTKALGLPCAQRAELVAKLLASFGGKADALVERDYLDGIRSRRAAVRTGTSRLLEGSTALRRVRATIGR